MPVQWETVAIPFSSGIQPMTRARWLDPQKLQAAQNCFYLQEQGPQKRNGHVAHTVKTSAPLIPFDGLVVPGETTVRDLYSTADPGISSFWLYGWGLWKTSDTSSANTYNVSAWPQIGHLFGSAARDQEILSWDGHRVFSYAPSQTSLFGETSSTDTTAATARGPAMMPMLQTTPIAKIASGQIMSDAADNGALRVVAWLNADLTSAGYSVYDTANGSALVSNSKLTFTGPTAVRCVSVGAWFHILVADPAVNSLEMRSFHQDTPTAVVSRTLGTVDSVFDVKKTSETGFLVAKSKTNVVTIVLLSTDGTTIDNIIPNLGGSPASTNLPLAVEFSYYNTIGLLWYTTGAPHSVNFAEYTLSGNIVAGTPTVVSTATTALRATLAPRVVSLTANLGFVHWDIYIQDFAAGISFTKAVTITALTAPTTVATRQHTGLGSHAFRVGNRTFVWCISGFNDSLQSTWFLCDSGLLPVGKAAYGLAKGAGFLSSVNWHTDSVSQPYKDRVVFHGTLPVVQRAQTVSVTNPNGVFTEPSILFFKLDFLPPLRSAQAGRATYFAGAQLWSYDGAEVVEAGFHLAPDKPVLARNAGAGSLSAGDYRYRVDICHKNAQNEEVRSWSIVSDKITAVLNDSVSVKINNVPMTRREDAYFLIFRTEANQSTYYLVNSRDPTSASFVKNNMGAASYTFVDTTADTALIGREYHPANTGGNYLDPLPAPACELVAGGRDRLWLAGGELAPGEVAPSRLFSPGQAPAFSPALNIQIDRNAEPITAVGFLGDLAAVFRRTSTYIVDSDGPDNSLNGAWTPPRLAIADTGAIGPEGLALTVLGLWFQSPAGLRLLTNAGSMDRAGGLDVDPITSGAKFASAIVVPQYTQVRWYSRDLTKPSIVLDYSSNSWTLWTGLHAVGAQFWPTSNLAVLTKPFGAVWVETLDTWTDAGSSYEMIVKTAPMRGVAAGDFQRVRRFALFGEADQALTAVRSRLFYDEREFHDQEVVRTFPLNDTEWGDGGTWGGDGPWGDENADPNGSSLWFRDGKFKFRVRPTRQKCSVFSIEFSDLGATNGGFQPVALALELGKKPGLDRIPTA